MTPFDFLLLNLAAAFEDSPPGLIVCSSDVLLDFGKVKKADWTRPGVTGLGIPMPIDYGTRHGVYISDETINELEEEEEEEEVHLSPEERKKKHQ